MKLKKLAPYIIGVFLIFGLIFLAKFMGLFNILAYGNPLEIPIDGYTVTLKGSKDIYKFDCTDELSYQDPYDLKSSGYDEFGCETFTYKKQYLVCETDGRCGERCSQEIASYKLQGKGCVGKTSTYNTYCSSYCKYNKIIQAPEYTTFSKIQWYNTHQLGLIYDVSQNGTLLTHFGQSSTFKTIVAGDRYDYTDHSDFKYQDLTITITDFGNPSDEYAIGTLTTLKTKVDFCYGTGTKCKTFAAANDGKAYKTTCLNCVQYVIPDVCIQKGINTAAECEKYLIEYNKQIEQPKPEQPKTDIAPPKENFFIKLWEWILNLFR